jgi:predicted DNA-binding WGR domain protein
MIVAEHYLECRQGSSNKFYEIKLERQTNPRGAVHYFIELRWGRIGAQGRTETKAGFYRRQHEAEREINRIITSKRAKGYILQTKKQKAKRKKEALTNARSKGEETVEDILLGRFGEILE